MEGSLAGVAGPLASAPSARTPLRSRRSNADMSQSSTASPTSPSFTTRPPSRGRDSVGLHSPGGAEADTVKHQLRILRGEVAKL